MMPEAELCCASFSEVITCTCEESCDCECRDCWCTNEPPPADTEREAEL
jgi:hypothetical protein